jgi:hypothetical protein
MTGPETTPPAGTAGGDQVKPRVLLAGGSITGALGIAALAAGEFRHGGIGLGVGVAGLVLGADRSRWPRVWYMAALALALMGGGAAASAVARTAGSGTRQALLFLLAGVLLWMGVTCLIAAVVGARRGGAVPSPRPGARRARARPPAKGSAQKSQRKRPAG